MSPAEVKWKIRFQGICSTDFARVLFHMSQMHHHQTTCCEYYHGLFYLVKVEDQGQMDNFFSENNFNMLRHIVISLGTNIHYNKMVCRVCDPNSVLPRSNRKCALGA